jgi:molybdopterin converting factor small subunit
LLAALRDAIGKTTESFPFATLAQAHAALLNRLAALAQAYAAVATKVKEGDPRAADVLAALRDAIGKTRNIVQLPALAQAYAAVATKVKEGDSRAADEFAALRYAIGKTTDSDQLAALAQAYAAVAKAAHSAIAPEQDIALLLARMPSLRTPDQVEAFAAAIKETIRLGRP